MNVPLALVVIANTSRKGCHIFHNHLSQWFREFTLKFGNLSRFSSIGWASRKFTRSDDFFLSFHPLSETKMSRNSKSFEAIPIHRKTWLHLQRNSRTLWRSFTTRIHTTRGKRRSRRKWVISKRETRNYFFNAISFHQSFRGAARLAYGQNVDEVTEAPTTKQKEIFETLPLPEAIDSTTQNGQRRSQKNDVSPFNPSICSVNENIFLFQGSQCRHHATPTQRQVFCIRHVAVHFLDWRWRGGCESCSGAHRRGLDEPWECDRVSEWHPTGNRLFGEHVQLETRRNKKCRFRMMF